MEFICCSRQTLVNFDHTYMDIETREISLRLHRVCSRCWTRWLEKSDGTIEKMTGKEWDARLKEAFSPENI